MLRTIHKETYFHVSRGGSWESGREYFIGEEENHFIRNHMNREFVIKAAGANGLPLNIAASAMLYHLKTGEKPPELERIYHFEADKTIHEALAMSQHYLTLIREMILEDVRKEYFPEMPSRKKCMWVIPDKKESLAFWLPRLKNPEATILKVELSGKLHRSPQRNLMLNSFSASYIRQNAFTYWMGNTSSELADDECIFQGQMKVVEVINQ